MKFISTITIPLFISCIIFEWIVSHWRKKPIFRLNNIINNISCGVIESISFFLLKSLSFTVYIWLYHSFALFPLNHDWQHWLLGFLAVDVCYYAFHRASHRVNLFWLGHAVHHQSEDYNLSVSLRQGVFQDVYSWLFFLPLAVMGMSPLMFMVLYSITLLYQLWLHTQLIGRLGPLELIFNTPSHHRVHHGKNPQYIDKNFAGTLIIWDKLFGTFAAEHETVQYGLTTPLNSWNPLWAQIQYAQVMWQKFLSLSGLLDKCLVWVMPPEWKTNIHHLGMSDTETEKYDVRPNQWIQRYVLLQIFLVCLCLYWFLIHEQTVSSDQLCYLSAMIIFSVWTLGGLQDTKKWMPWLEGLRLLLASLWLTMTFVF